MKNMIQGKNTIIIFLCVTIIFLAIGFVFLSVNLEQHKKDSHSFQVLFSKIEKVSSIKGGSNDPYGNASIINHGHEIEMEFELDSVHDEITYIATIKNKGEVAAKIVDIMESPNTQLESIQSYFSPTKIELSNITSKVLEPMDTIELKINVSYPVTKEKKVPRKLQYKIGLITEPY